MTTRLRFYVLAGVVGVALVLLSGCYTQLGTVKEDRWSDDQYTYSNQQPQADTSYQGEEQNEEYQNGSECYDDWYYQHPRVGFSYYYPSAFWPSAAFSLAYADPWFYDYNWAYDPWYYSPYYAYPYYSYYRPYYYDNPWWSYYSSNGATVHRGSRDFGNTRTTGGRVPTDVRNGAVLPAVGDRGTTNLPTGARLGKAPNGGGTPGRTSSAAPSNGRRTGNVSGTNRSSTGRSTGAVRGSTSSRGGVTRGSGTQQSRPRPAYAPPPAQAPGHSNSPHYRPNPGTRNSGGSRGAAPTYSPPPSRAPSSSPPRSSPPPSSGGGSRGGGSPRGGGHR
jgi:hypothetical protein